MADTPDYGIRGFDFSSLLDFLEDIARIDDREVRYPLSKVSQFGCVSSRGL